MPARDRCVPKHLHLAEMLLPGPMERCKWLVKSADARVPGLRQCTRRAVAVDSRMGALCGQHRDALEHCDQEQATDATFALAGLVPNPIARVSEMRDELRRRRQRGIVVAQRDRMVLMTPWMIIGAGRRRSGDVPSRLSLHKAAGVAPPRFDTKRYASSSW